MILQVSYMSSRILSNANTQLVQHFHSNSMQILIQYTSAHDCAFNASTNNSTNNCAKKYQLPNHDLSSLLQLKQQYIYSKSLNKFSISFKQHANHVTIYLRMITLSNNQLQFNKQLFKEISTTKP